MPLGPGNLFGFTSILRHFTPARPSWRILLMTSTIQGSAAVPLPWHAAYPAPNVEAPSVTRQSVLEMLRDGNNVAGKDFVLVDLRRSDHEVCFVTPNPNRPEAQ